MQQIPLLVIAGPTASGKSALAIAMAKSFNGEIISADSMQVYRQLNIGTAKEVGAAQQGVVHHGQDVRNYQENFSVADFLQEADQAITAIHQRGKVPIVVGGTGFYIKALLGYQQLDYGPSDPAAVAKDEQRPLAVLQAEFRALADADFQKRVDIQNKVRLVRALQILRTGPRQAAERPNYDALVLALDWPRAVLYDRINQRVDDMIAQGLEQEARLLYEAGGLNLQAGRGIGYKEFYPYFEGQIALVDAVAQIKQDSRRYAKRQLTYWRHQIPGLHWLPGSGAADIAEPMISAFLKKK
ncbi:tRNA (adenosine(37)-N6)-dimethylallyltransferase MiaA [Leuconostocaceae bacterium ESL0958]|nr:tRNA (adenosine(37)-N6)-dimethylallyltransferase MiaA [Leuconostocaceae bacterium ESL0958]